MKNLLGLAFTVICLVSINAQQKRVQQDITGGAALIFKRPANPTTQAREGATADEVRSARSATSDQIEDAIALGNTARDRKPPDFESAEKAYRLAWKLNPRDPRPYLGLGNLYWDQRRYVEAAKAYRDAVRAMEDASRKRALYEAGIGLGVSRMSDLDVPPSARARKYLAASLLQEQDPLGAERELRLAVLVTSDNAEWNSLFAYALAAQGRYTEAVEAYEKAVKREPLNEKYKELLAEASQKARETSANDGAIIRRLQNTIWEIRDVANSTIKGTCQLDASGPFQCKSVGSGLTLSNGRWRVRDGILGLEGSFKIPFCLGQLQVARIDVECYSNDSETRDLWINLKK
jgi:tetratricopeptide (TPR) repeat protein